MAMNPYRMYVIVSALSLYLYFMYIHGKTELTVSVFNSNRKVKTTRKLLNGHLFVIVVVFFFTKIGHKTGVPV